MFTILKTFCSSGKQKENIEQPGQNCAIPILEIRKESFAETNILQEIKKE